MKFATLHTFQFVYDTEKTEEQNYKRIVDGFYGQINIIVRQCKINGGLEMSKLTTEKRKSLQKKDFALPKEKKYPIPDKKHAVNAKARATQMVKKGKLSKAKEKVIDAKANKVIKGKKK